MDYMTLKEASKIWGVTPRWINYYCSSGRILGAIKMGTIWLIPKNAEKPIDGRTKQGRKLKMQRILYVEDDLSLIDGLQYTLETSGYTVDNARTIKRH